MSNLDHSRLEHWEKAQAETEANRRRDATLPSTSGGGGSTLDGMERIAKLEARADMTDQRLGRIEDKLDRILERTGSLPTTNGLWGMVATVLGVGLAIAGLTFVIAEWVAP